MPYTSEKIVSTLLTVPARDGNFKSALDLASEDQVTAAIVKMIDTTGAPLPGHKSRVTALRRRLRQLRRGADG
jgi:hypothetical protein